MRNTRTGRKLDRGKISPRFVRTEGTGSRTRGDNAQHSTDDQHRATLTALARLLGALAAREQVAACHEEGERDGA